MLLPSQKRRSGNLPAKIIILHCFLSLWLYPAHGFASTNKSDATIKTSSLRLGLFSLFQPQQLTIRLTSSTPVLLSAGNLRDMPVTGEATIHLRKAGRQINLTISDAYGRVKQSTNAAEVRLFAAQPPTFTVTVPGKISRKVRGNLRITAPQREQTAALQLVLTAEREAVVASIVAAETSGVHQPEALKAVAVVVRTYLQAHQSRHAAEGFDFCDTTHCQFYRGEDDLANETTSRPVTDAVTATAGEVLRFNSQLVEGFYTAVCGGLTASPEAVWGGATASQYPYKRVACTWCSASPYHRWQREVAVASLRQSLAVLRQTPLSQALSISIQKYPASEVVEAVIIQDSTYRISVSGDKFRRLVGRKIGWNRILSPTFTVERRGNFFVFRGRGFGSQVGLCIAGTISQAQAGRTYREILNFYYPQTESLSGQE